MPIYYKLFHNIGLYARVCQEPIHPRVYKFNYIQLSNGVRVWEGGGASPHPRVKKILKNTNEMNTSEDFESTDKIRISRVFMLIFFKDSVRLGKDT